MNDRDDIIEDIEEDLKEDAMEDEAEAMMDIQQQLEAMEGGPVPMPEEKHDVLSFLKGILGDDNRFKTAYLTWEELGKPNFSTRFWLNLANACDRIYKFKIVAEYCELKARVTTDTSLSRDGFMVSTAVTTRKVREKKGGGDLAKFLAGRDNK